MKNNFLTILIFIFIVSVGCNKRDPKTDQTKLSDTISTEQGDDLFPKVQNLNQFKGTDFIPTLQNSFDPKNNAIYCSTLLLAWNELRNVIKTPLEIDNKYKALQTINKSESFKDVLEKDGYTATAKVNIDRITLTAEFKKLLPFQVPLRDLPKELTFAGQEVESFGILGICYQALMIIQIQYYKNDNDFIIRLQPNDKNHEIILYKTTKRFATLEQIVNDVEMLREKAKADMKNNWKYDIADMDRIVIPKIKFNIEHDYETLIGNKFSSNKTDFEIERAYQRIAFILDENGAAAESNAQFDISSDESDIKPRDMLFNKPFFLMLKRKDNKNPYLAAWIANTEVMIKE